MYYNQHLFNGQVTWHKEKKIGDTWGVISTKISLPVFEFQLNGSLHRIERPFLWFDIKVSYKDGALIPYHKAILEHCQSKNYILVHNGTISSFDAKKSGSELTEKRFKIDSPATGVSFSRSPFMVFNQSILGGNVEEFDNGKLILSVPYRNKEEKKYRHVKVVCDKSLTDNSIKGNRVIIIGSVCGVNPKGDSDLYVVAKSITRL